ncbi:MAG: LysM peptidoglycan-binding domain-containing protein [Fibromonadaceae bacterium]|nr:LysM peptidoglycan-binding domain-containing protein [Fibromonadaceae bacterium]
MNYFRAICVFLLPAILFSACSTARQSGAVSVSKHPKNSTIKTVDLPEPVGAAGKTSWLEYKSGKQAAEAEDILTAIYYLDLALSELYTEQRMDSLGQPEDSIYFSTMPNRIVLDLESLYPKLLNQTQSQAFSLLNDYEKNIDDFEETPLDSAEKEILENFLDTTDLSKFSLPLTVNARVMQEIHFLTVNARTFTEGSLSRKTALDSMIYAKLKQRNMPEDLIYLAFIESGFKLHAYSRAKAAGVWQFIPGTGKRYGLPVDFWLDMRRNPEAATDAALSYLSDLYNEFGDWYLAMAAYNCGEGRIRRLVRENTTDSSKKVSYWDLKLPRETMLYVPRILAAAIIGHFPENYSFTVEKQSRVPFDTVTIKDCIPLDKAGSAVGASINTMRELNPELTRWCTPPNLKTYTMKVPKGSREKFLAAYEKMDKTQLVRWQQYKVQRGDNLGQISRLFGLRVADIQAANNLRNTRLSVGQVLIIPMPTGANPPEKQRQIEKQESAAALAKKQLFDTPTEKTGLSIRSYVVRRGDNLSSISRRFGISSQNLMAWNNLQTNKVIIGQRLYLQDPSKQDSKKNEGLAPITQKEVKGTSYIIKQGDNLWEIARNNNVTVQQLLEWNPGLDKKIYPGMKIKIGD